MNKLTVIIQEVQKSCKNIKYYLLFEKKMLIFDCSIYFLYYDVVKMNKYYKECYKRSELGGKKKQINR